MSNAEKVSEQIKNMSLSDLLKLAAMSLENKMSDSHIEFIFIHLEIALQKYRMMKQLGIK